MITKVTAKLLSVDDETAILTVEAFQYEVLIPEFARRQLQGRIGETVELHTIHYLDGNPAHGRITPRLIGFLSSVEREFFELICTVDGLGVKKALRAMVRPVREVAELIEQQDAKSLAALPGIGPATAERMIAKLRRKMPKFALLVVREMPGGEDAGPDVVRLTFELLCRLGHSEMEARKLIDRALEGKRGFKDVESMVQAVYDASHAKGN
jgi:Holliday junction DNA helicase RuvA